MDLKRWKQLPLYLKKLNRSSLIVAGCIVLFVLVLGCGALLAGEALPDNPIADASDFDADALTQLLDSDENEAVYVPVPVASSDTTSEQEQQTDSGVDEQPPEEEEEPPEDEEEPEPEAPKTTPVANPNSAAANANVGGAESGGNDANGQTTDKVYFTTSIKDGETVTDSAYSFEITHKYPELTVKSQEVFVNNSLVPQFRGTVTLSEGENTIRVKASYTDESGKAIGPVFKDYKVNLDSKSLVINTSIPEGGETVAKDQYTFTASAAYLGKAVGVTVTCNGTKVSKVKGTEGSYRVKLKDGANAIVISAKADNDLTASIERTVTYTSDGNFDFDIYVGDTVITDGTYTTTEETLTFEVWMANDAGGNVKFNATLGQTALNGKSLGDGGYRFTVPNLSYGDKNRISVTARSGDQNMTHTCTVNFQRPQAGPDNPNPDPEHAPSIKTYPDLTNGYTTNNSVFTLDIETYNYLGERLYGGSITLWLNGSEIKAGWQNERTTYRLNLTQPENTVNVFMVDEYGYSRYYTFTLHYEKAEENQPIGYVTISLEATTVGLGYLIPPTQCPIYDNQSFSYVLQSLLADNGYTATFSGDMEQFYLAAVSKPGLTDNINIPPSLVGYIEAANKEITAPKPDSLEQTYITGDSGWMYCINGFYPNYGLGVYYPADGDRICIRFTLFDSGADIGANPNHVLPEVFIEQE